MNRGERVVVALFCLGCLTVPIGMLLGGVLEPAEGETGAGAIIYTKGKYDLKVKRTASHGTLRVQTRNAGRPAVERDGDMMPTDEVEGAAHHDAHEITVRERYQSGITPADPAGE